MTRQVAKNDVWKRPWVEASDAIRQTYGHYVGTDVNQLMTPALTVDVKALQRNVNVMMAAVADWRSNLRPHTKVQKSPNIAQLQLEAGAIGVTVATVWEAAAMAASGVADVLIANEVVGQQKLLAAARLARHLTLTMVVDDLANIAALSEACVLSGSVVRILVDLDVGMARCGARTPDQALALARAVDAADNLVLAGVQAYEGHCMLEPDRATRVRLAHKAMDYAAAVRDLLRQDGLSAPTLSGGGTGTYDITGANPNVTELQAGSFVFMDAFHGNLVSGFEVSLAVLSTVVARHGDTVILDAGRKSVGIDFVLPPIAKHDYVARYYAEEHALFDVDSRFTAHTGDLVRLTPGYAPTTVNLHDVFFAIEGDEVVDVWPIFPRGPLDHGFSAALADSL